MTKTNAKRSCHVWCAECCLKRIRSPASEIWSKRLQNESKIFNKLLRRSIYNFYFHFSAIKASEKERSNNIPVFADRRRFCRAQVLHELLASPSDGSTSFDSFLDFSLKRQRCQNLFHSPVIHHLSTDPLGDSIAWQNDKIFQFKFAIDFFFH